MPAGAATAYDLIVIGAGAAGSTAAFEARAQGARVAMAERWKVGGTCLNAGCDPTKALVRAARALHEARHASRFGDRSRGRPRRLAGGHRPRRARHRHHPRRRWRPQHPGSGDRPAQGTRPLPRSRRDRGRGRRAARRGGHPRHRRAGARAAAAGTARDGVHHQRRSGHAAGSCRAHWPSSAPARSPWSLPRSSPASAWRSRCWAATRASSRMRSRRWPTSCAASCRRRACASRPA